MRNAILAAAAVALFGMGSASAADLNGGIKDAMVYEPAAGWSGAYIGVSGGSALSSPKFSDLERNIEHPICFSFESCGDAQAFGGLIGGTLGYNWQIRNLVLGVEGDISWAGLDAKSKTNLSPSQLSFMQSNIDAIATLRGRVGYAAGSNLFYLTGGAAFLDTQHKAIRLGADCNALYSPCSDNWQTGFVAGAGYEAMLTGNLSFKIEYLYIGTPTQTLTQTADATVAEGFADNVQVARVGLNYKLGGGSAGYAPLMAGASSAGLSGSMKDAVAYEPAGGWSGAYIGISGGMALSSPKFSDLGQEICLTNSSCGDAQAFGGLAGGTLGYNWQIRNLVLGFEGDISWAGLDAKSKTSPLSGSYMQSNIDAIATLRGRAGYATGGNLFYLTGGAAFLDTQHRAIELNSACNVHFSPCSDSWQTGFVAGAGYEAMLTNNLSFKAEYLYIGTPTQTLAQPDWPTLTEGFADNVQIARVGLNYKLGGGSSGYMPLK